MSRTLGDAQIHDTRLRQVLRSWYIFVFHSLGAGSPFLSFHFRVGRRSLLRSSRPGTFSAEDLAQILGRPGRSPGYDEHDPLVIARYFAIPPNSRRTVRVPTRILWGERDAFYFLKMAHESQRYCTDAELYTFANASTGFSTKSLPVFAELLIDFSANRLALSAVPVVQVSIFYSIGTHNFRTGSERSGGPHVPPRDVYTSSSQSAESVAKNS